MAAERLVSADVQLTPNGTVHLFTTLDDKRVRNPVSDVPEFERLEPQPHALPYEVI